MNFKNLAFFVSALFLLAACGESKNPVRSTSIEEPLIPINYESARAALNRFALLNSEGKKAAPKVDGREKFSPVGALIAFVPTAGKYTGSTFYCTVSHLKNGKVATNSHCVRPGLPIENYYIAYYNKLGKYSYTPVKKFEYVSDLGNDPRYIDIAILRISEDAARTWDEAGDYVDIASSKDINAHPPATQKIKIWSYDPIAAWPKFHQASADQAKWGMVFSPRECSASRTIPYGQFVFETEDGSEHSRIVSYTRFKFEPNSPVELERNGKRHNTLMDCVGPDGKKRDPLHGNSGSLMTGIDFRRKIGVLAGGVPASAADLQERVKRQGLKRYEMVDNNGELRRIPLDKDSLIFGTGIAFDFFKATIRPDLFSTAD